MRLDINRGDQAFTDFFKNGPTDRDLHKYLLEQAGETAIRCLQKAAKRRSTRALVTGIPPRGCDDEGDPFLPITVKIDSFNLHRPNIDLDIT
jgi:hypothetical protein